MKTLEPLDPKKLEIHVPSLDKAQCCKCNATPNKAVDNEQAWLLFPADVFTFWICPECSTGAIEKITKDYNVQIHHIDGIDVVIKINDPLREDTDDDLAKGS